ncbi:hypothetical protein I6I10_03680 [Corynebacterium glucuronolyticum]|uniref:Uncharacterized protein n=1 Tax=Corynebacterium glucuronolyticum TaxID=39791 RepID=A0A7T4JVL3_9CORY|nr:hypothetical protein [Corynebacterium glucuronolyticum]QQB47027.1 hypothetical protein I6I10_03680 [Corynebacterium glucuronolyticum]WKD64681.1 hypothetical protein CGLUCO_12330 [Corynebacterium glucuronolyticum DSM 44120]SMB82139.1 hypothetical protein SAMN05660745_02561 [Corynebacterium glucuronolyticum]
MSVKRESKDQQPNAAKLGMWYAIIAMILIGIGVVPMVVREPTASHFLFGVALELIGGAIVFGVAVIAARHRERKA